MVRGSEIRSLNHAIKYAENISLHERQSDYCETKHTNTSRRNQRTAPRGPCNKNSTVYHAGVGIKKIHASGCYGRDQITPTPERPIVDLLFKRLKIRFSHRPV